MRLRRGVSGAAAEAAAASTVLARGFSRIDLATYDAKCDRQPPPNTLPRAPSGVGPRIALTRALNGAMLAAICMISLCGRRLPLVPNTLLRALSGVGLEALERVFACKTYPPAEMLTRALVGSSLAKFAGVSAGGERTLPAMLPCALRGACLSVCGRGQSWGRPAPAALLLRALGSAFLIASGRAIVCERRLSAALLLRALCSAAPAGLTTGLLPRLMLVLGCVGRRSATMVSC